jgi:hypothetical protein
MERLDSLAREKAGALWSFAGWSGQAGAPQCCAPTSEVPGL